MTSRYKLAAPRYLDSYHPCLHAGRPHVPMASPLSRGGFVALLHFGLPEPGIIPGSGQQDGQGTSASSSPLVPHLINGKTMGPTSETPRVPVLRPIQLPLRNQQSNSWPVPTKKSEVCSCSSIAAVPPHGMALHDARQLPTRRGHVSGSA